MPASRPTTGCCAATAPDLEADDGADPSPVALKARALAIEEAARAVPGITNSEGAGMSAGRTVVALATSQGFARGYTTSGYGGSASVIAGDRRRACSAIMPAIRTRHYADLDAPEAIGRLAGERAVKRLDPGKLASGTMPVLFDPRVGGSLIGHLLGAITGPAIARKTSFLLGREDGAAVRLRRSSSSTIRTGRRGLRSKPFDGEGVRDRAGARWSTDGRLTGWLLNSASARQLGLETTGHASARHRRRARRRRDQRPSRAGRVEPGGADGRHQARPLRHRDDRQRRSTR